MHLSTFELELIGRAIAYVDSCLEDKDTKPQGFDDDKYEAVFTSVWKKTPHGSSNVTFTKDELEVAKKVLELYADHDSFMPYMHRDDIRFEKEVRELRNKLEHME